MAKQLSGILRLRRDNDYNYSKVANKFIPANGEICLVDTARSGLRVICGDGVTPFARLEYVDDVYSKGYLKDNKFYKEVTCENLLNDNTNLLYIDLFTSKIFYYDGELYQEILRSDIATASENSPGIMKLYTTTGQNIDGTMTQKAITDELDTKVELTLKEEEELVIFSL